MSLAAVLTKLRALEGGADLATSIQGVFDTQANELAQFRTKATTAEASLARIATAIGAKEGDDVETLVRNSSAKVTQLTQQVSTLEGEKTTLATGKTEAEGKLTALERKILLQDAATKAGADPTVFTRLAGDLPVKIDGDKVLVGKDGEAKPLKEFAEGTPDWKPFLPSLFPAGTGGGGGGGSNNPPGNRLPSNPPGGDGTNKTADPLATVNARYSIPKHLQPSNAGAGS